MADPIPPANGDVPANPPVPPAAASSPENVNARIAELAAAFALGELNDLDLREFYNYLRADGAAGPAAAAIAWQQLGTVTDLRAALSQTFQDTVRHRLAQAGSSQRFTSAMRNRLGAGRPTLEPVTWPVLGVNIRPRWVLIASVTVATIAVAAVFAFAANGHRESGGCVVSSVQGDAQLSGMALTPGAAIFGGEPVAVQPGGQIALQWPDGTTAVLAGPANAVVQPGGLSLTAGTAWVTAGATFTCGLPDATLRAGAGSRSAVAVDAFRSVVGVVHGSVAVGQGHGDHGVEHPNADRTLGEGTTAAAAGGSPLRWRSLSSGTVAPGVAAYVLDGAVDWRFAATVAWRGADDHVRLGVRGADGSNLIDLTMIPGSVSLALAVTTLAATPDAPAIPAHAPQTIAITGPPLAALPFEFIAISGHVTVEVAGRELASVDLPPASSLTIDPPGWLGLTAVAAHTGPPPMPPLAVDAKLWPETNLGW